MRFDFATSLQQTKIEGGGSLGGALKQTILQPVTGGERWSDYDLLHTDLADLIDQMPGSSNYDTRNPILENNAVTDEKFTRMVTVNAGLEIDIIKDLTPAPLPATSGSRPARTTGTTAAPRLPSRTRAPTAMASATTAKPSSGRLPIP